MESAFDKLQKLFADDEDDKRKIANKLRRETRAFRVSKKLCIYCGKSPRPGLQTCQRCADQMLNWQIAKKKKENPNYKYVPRPIFKHITSEERKMGYRTCWGCKQKVHPSAIYRRVTKAKDGKTQLVTCSEKCWRKYIDHQNAYAVKRCGKSYGEIMDEIRERKEGEKLCQILKEHDEVRKDDPNKLNIRKYLRKHVECK